MAWAESYIGGIYHIQGDDEKTTQILNPMLSQKKKQYISSFIIAGLFNFLEDKDKTFEWLEIAYQERDILMSLFHTFGIFDNLRADLRFKTLMKKMGWRNDRQYHLPQDIPKNKLSICFTEQ